MEEMMKSSIGMNKKTIREMLEDEELLDLQAEFLDKMVKKLEERGYTTDQAISLISSSP